MSLSQSRKCALNRRKKKKTEGIDDISEGSDEDLYTGSQIFQRPPPTESNAKQISSDAILTMWIRKKS